MTFRIMRADEAPLAWSVELRAMDQLAQKGKGFCAEIVLGNRPVQYCQKRLHKLAELRGFRIRTFTLDGKIYAHHVGQRIGVRA